MKIPKSNKTIKAWALLLGIIASLMLSSCDVLLPYQPPVKQGNIITAGMVSQLKLGMSTQQVITTMGGDPILVNTFSDNSMTYIYTFKPSRKKVQTTKVTLTFKDNKLSNIQTEPVNINDGADASKPAKH